MNIQKILGIGLIFFGILFIIFGGYNLIGIYNFWSPHPFGIAPMFGTATIFTLYFIPMFIEGQGNYFQIILPASVFVIGILSIILGVEKLDICLYKLK